MARVRDAMGMGTPGGQAQALVNTFGDVTGTGTGSQGAGVLLSYGSNNLITASSLDTFVMPTAAQGAGRGDVMTAYGSTATSAVVYPGGSDTINGSTSAVTIAQNKMGTFQRMSATNWGYVVTA